MGVDKATQVSPEPLLSPALSELAIHLKGHLPSRKLRKWEVYMCNIWGIPRNVGDVGSSEHPSCRKDAEAFVGELKAACMQYTTQVQENSSHKLDRFKATSDDDAQAVENDKDMEMDSTLTDDLPAQFEKLDIKQYQLLSQFFDADQLTALFAKHRYGRSVIDTCEISWHPFREMEFMWVRAEYIRFKDYIENEGESQIVITGQPGIGKTWMLRYLLEDRLRQAKPVLYCVTLDHSSYWLFDKGQVYEIPISKIEGNPGYLEREELPEGSQDMWILMDSKKKERWEVTRGNERGEIPRWVSANELPSKFVFASSPQYERWNRNEQDSSWFKPEVIYMNPWSQEEARLLAILYAIIVLREPSSNVNFIRKFVSLSQELYAFKPTPRIFIEGLVRDCLKEIMSSTSHAAKEELLRDELKERIDSIQYDASYTVGTLPCISLTGWFSVGGSSGLLHHLFLVFRDPTTTDSGERIVEREHCMEFINEDAKETLMDHLRQYDTRRNLILWEKLTNDTKTRRIARNMHEYRLQKQWRGANMVQFTMHTMQPLLLAPNVKNQSRYTYSPGETEGEEIAIPIFKYLREEPKVIEKNVLYYPHNPNYPTIDFLIRKDETYYGLQTMLRDMHDITAGLRRILEKIPSSSRYIHVFVIGQDEEFYAQCPRSGPWEHEYPFPVKVAVIPYQGRSDFMQGGEFEF